MDCARRRNMEMVVLIEAVPAVGGHRYCAKLANAWIGDAGT